MEKTKITKKEKYGMLLKIEEVAKNPMLVEFINKEVELLNKKNSKNGQTKTQKDNVGIKDIIVEVLKAETGALTISEIQDKNETLAGYTNQKMSALLAQLVNEKIIERVKEKKVTMFRYIGE